MAKIKVYSYTNYRQFLTDYLDALKAAGESFRKIALTCEIGSPNYFQQILSGRRNLTVETASKIAKGFALDRSEQEYFETLVALDTATGDLAGVLLDRLKAVLIRSGRYTIKDASIHSSWLHAVIWELAAIEAFILDPENISARLRGGMASTAEINESLEYLVKKGYLVATDKPHVYTQREITFEPLNDIRRIEIQQCHFRMLDIAKHKLNDDLSDREFQGLTVAIPAARMNGVKQRLREFILSLNDEFSHNPGADTVIHVHCGAYKLVSK